MKSKKKVAVIGSRAEAESAMNELANIITNQRTFLALYDAELLAVNKRFESGIATYKQEVEEKTNALQAWAESNPAEFPKDRKSLDLVSGVIGFRTGNPKLALLSRAWKWETVLEKLRTMASRFVRTVPEVDKDAMLREYAQLPDKESTDQLFKLYGVKVVQDEKFYADPKLAPMEARQTAEVI